METSEGYKYLGHINSPQDLKAVPEENIGELMDEIRRYLIHRVSENGGHLASNLGVVELTVALHRVFNCPHDHIIWDVGHQSYVHKILTGRFCEFDTLRKNGGISGFTKRSESQYDCFGAGHSSTSVSAGLGFAQADRLSGSDAFTVIILGDGAFTGGMIHEALNNCAKDLRLIIIINENEMSISRNIGRFATNLAHIRRAPGYIKTKRATGRAVKRIPLIGDEVYNILRDTKQCIKNTLYGSNYFEDLGLYYLGPADGNDYNAVVQLLSEAKSQRESVVIHLKTQKGKGYAPAEQNPNRFHGMSPALDKCPVTDFSDIMGKKLSEIAETDKKICAITAAMCDGTGLSPFRSAHPERYFDVGIAEEHAVTFAAGLAAENFKPVVAIYSTFLQRSYDQIIHDVVIQKLHVVFCVDRAGFNERDGITHHGIYDVAFISQMNGMRIYTPVTYKGLELSLTEALGGDGPAAIRYPHDCENDAIDDMFYYDTCDSQICVRINKGYDKDKCDAVVITYGRIVTEAISAASVLAEADGLNIGILLCEYLMPYDKLADEIAGLLPDKDIPIVYLEEGIRAGGASMILADKLHGYGKARNKEYTILAAGYDYDEPTAGVSIRACAGIDSASVVSAIRNITQKLQILKESENES